jgi:hypothetical protein
MKTHILISLVILSSVLTVNAQWDKNADNWSTGNLTLRNMSNVSNAGSYIHLTSYSDNCLGPRISSSLIYASGTSSKANLILSSYWEGYKNELVLSNGNVGIGNNNPQFPLHIEKSINGELNLLIKNTYGTGTRTFLTATPDRSMLQTDRDFGIWTNGNGWGERFTVKNNGNVGIGTTNPQSLLAVKGKITAQEVEVTMTGWSDFVFQKNYNLISLEDLEKYINENRHLPDVPSEQEVKEKGLNLGQNDAVLLQKIEELTLYVIEQNKTQKELIKEIQTIKEKNSQLEEKIEKIGLNK